jgi:hypothetical protein
MPDIGQNRTLSEAVAAKPVGDQASRRVLKAVQQTFEKALGRHAVPTILHQDVRFCQGSRQNRLNEQYADKSGDLAVMICCAEPNARK